MLRRRSGKFRRSGAPLLLLMVPLVWVWLVGCTDSDPVVNVRMDNPVMGRSGSFALLALVHEPGEDRFDSSQASLRVSGQFVNHRNIGRRWVIGALDLDLAELPMTGAPGQCVIHDGGSQGVMPLSGMDPEQDIGDAQIDLLDAGELLLVTPDGLSSVSPREFPSILMSLGGVIYHREALPFFPEGEYMISGAGGREVGPFHVSVPAPRSLGILGVNGLSGSASDGGTVAVSAGQEIQVTWEETDAQSDFMHVALYGAGRTVSCVAPDEGAFSIPSFMVRKIPSGKVELVLQRVRTTPFRASGVRGGEVVFLVQDWVDLELKD